MKFLKYLGGIFVVCLLALYAFSERAPMPDAASPNYRYTFTSDDLTTTSGNPQVILILQESNEYSGADNWYEVERDTSTDGESAVQRLHGGNGVVPAYVEGVRHRIILDGVSEDDTLTVPGRLLSKWSYNYSFQFDTSGTTVNTYTGEVTFKKDS